MIMGFLAVTSAGRALVCSQLMEQSSRPTFHPAGAGTLLATVTAASVGVGALAGWAAGSVGYGVLGGAIAGVPAGVAAVYYRYRGAL